MKGRYALLLNSDAVFDSGGGKQLWNFCESNKRPQLFCGQLLNADGSKQNSVASFPSLLTLAVNNSLLEYLFPRRYPSKDTSTHRPLKLIGRRRLHDDQKKSTGRNGRFWWTLFFLFWRNRSGLHNAVQGLENLSSAGRFIYHLQGQSKDTKPIHVLNFTALISVSGKMAQSSLLLFSQRYNFFRDYWLTEFPHSYLLPWL